MPSTMRLFFSFACIFGLTVATQLSDVETYFKENIHGSPAKLKHYITGTLRSTYFFTDGTVFVYDKGHNIQASLNGSDFVNINKMDYVTGEADGVYFTLQNCEDKEGLVLKDEENWKFHVYESNKRFHINYDDNKNATQINTANKILDKLNKVYEAFSS